MAALVEENFYKGAVALIDSRNEYLGNIKRVLISKTFVVLSQRVPARLTKINSYQVTLRNGTSLDR